MTVRFPFYRSEDYQRRAFAATGKRLDSQAYLEIEAEALDATVRARLVALFGLPSYMSGGVGYDLRRRLNPTVDRKFGWQKPEITVSRRDLIVDGELTGEMLPGLLELVEQDQVDIDALLPELEAAKAELVDREALAAREKAEREERERQARERGEAAKRAAQEKAETERSAWIEQHGSPFLRKATTAGYDCQRRYVLERAALEHPGAVLDYEDAAEWKSRSCPSEGALDKALAVGGEVVWLTAEPRDHRPTEGAEREDYYPFEPCEAIVIRGWLGRYDVVYLTW